MIRSAVRKAIEKVGYDITRRPLDDTADRYKDFPQESLINRRFYNIGAGEFHHPYWTNVDLANKWYQQVQKQPFLNYDLMALSPLPIASGTAELFYCCHVIEHISDEAVTNLCKEAYRCLKPGGVIRFLTPDAELEYNAYRRGDRDFFHWVHEIEHVANASLQRVFLNHFATQICEYDGQGPGTLKPVPDSEVARIFATLPMEQAFDHFTKQCTFDPDYAGNHINWWTDKKLGKILRDAGFAMVYRSGHGQSLSSALRDLRYFDATHYIRISLYMEAIK